MELESEKRLMTSIELRIRRLSEMGPLLQGSFVTKYQKCKSPNCPCHQGEKIHPYTVVSRTVNGHTQTLYIPVAMQEKAKIWNANFKRAKILLQEIADLTDRLVRLQVPKHKAQSRRLPSQAMN